MLITLSGLDGAGKSTLAEALRDDLEKHGTPTMLLHMNKQVGLYAYVRAVRDKLLLLMGQQPVPEKSPRFSGLNPPSMGLRGRIVWGKGLRRLVDVADLAIFFFYRLYIEKVRGRVLIMDRYFYDRLADTADGRKWQYLRWFSNLTPVPDIPIFVEVSPNEAYARKGEFSIPWMAARRANYQEIFSWISGFVVLPNDDVERATSEIKRLVRERIGNESRHFAVGS